MISLVSSRLTGESRLAVIRNKTKRAEKHFRELEITAEQHSGNREFVVVHDSDSQAGKMRMVTYMPFDIVLAAGDVIHNPRSALDHLAYHLVQVGGGKPTQRTGFPIADSADKYKSIRAKKVSGMAEGAITAIDKLRPYAGGNESLWRIHSLDIVDKHKELIVIAEEYFFTGEHFPASFMAIGEELHFSGIFATDTNDYADLSIEPSLAKPNVTKLQPLIPSLHQLIVFTDDLVGSFLPLLGG